MSNPVVTIGDYIPIPSDPEVVRKSFTRIAYESQRFYMYSEGQDSSTFDPIGTGDRLFITVATGEMWCESLGIPLSDPVPAPGFISDGAWDSIRYSPSVFVNAVKSVMTNIVIPSKILSENGLYTSSETGTLAAWWMEGSSKKGLFNWKVIERNGVAVSASDGYKWCGRGSYPGSNHLSFDYKDDKEADNSVRIRLENPIDPPGGETYNWLTSEKLVGTGAFALVLNVIPERPGSSSSQLASEQGWEFQIEFGEVTMRMIEAGEMRVAIDNPDASEKNWVSVNLMEGRTKGGPVQQEAIQGKNPYIIVVYPCWNGIVVSSGVQDARTSAFEIVTTQAASVCVPKLKEAAVMEEPWSEGFDPTDPDEVFAWSSDTESGSPLDPSENTVVDFGDQIDVYARNCKFDIAYVPAFFVPHGSFDEWFLASDGIPGEIEFEYDVWPIWTSNATAMSIGTPVVDDSPYALGSSSDSHYSHISWDLDIGGDQFSRRHGELFGSIIEITETRLSSIRNGNGNFDIAWIPSGLPGDKNVGSSPDWRDYVQSISVNMTKDGSSGQMVVDKYGPAGQDASVVQSIGAITFEMTGVPDGCVGGTFFKGLGMGVTDSKTAQGATWSVPLAGLEKKMEDIALINVPFMDGEPLGYVITFLSNYAGIIPNTAHANTLLRLSVSEDVNVARFDWSAGTSIRSALDDVMEDSNHTYVIQDGQIYFYELNAYGIPNWCASAPDWSVSYPNTKIVMDEQQPEFGNLRNKIVVLGMEVIYQGEGSNTENPPAVIRTQIRNSTTTPSIPWERAMVDGPPGYVTEAQLSDFADRKQAQSSHYITAGRTSIPGNANIRIWDRWGSLVIISVSHNVDFNAKTWTTDLEMANY
jgi:hypothetical protein